jgi:uncharacterized protein (TIGR00159 family)
MSFLFESFGILDILDIFLVALLIYQIYKLVRGTVAVNIFYGVFLIYLTWLLVRALNMQLLGSILGQVIGLGLVALLIVFQQEVRRFLLVIGTKYFRNANISLEHLLHSSGNRQSDWDFKEVVKACERLSKTKTGALLVFAKKSELRAFAETGCIVDARISSDLIETIFRKDSPLHDGGMILAKGRISSARCVLPVSDNPAIPAKLGLRHRAAVGMSENSDSFVVVVSEETGNISYANQGELVQNIKPAELLRVLPAYLKVVNF